MQASPPVAAPMVVSTIQTPQRKEHFLSNAVRSLSITQITIGALCILFQLVLIGIQSPLHFVGQGIWGGLFFVLTGVYGLKSSKQKLIGLIVTFLALAIISAVLAVGILLTSSFDIVFVLFGFGPRRPVGLYTPLAINALMLILAFTQAVVAIVSSALSCHGICGGDPNQSVVVAGRVQYVQGPDGQQQMVILPFDQNEAGLAAGSSSHPDQTQLPLYDQESPPPKYECETKLPIPE